MKGVTLENNGVASIPDAPTERGVKHVKELISCAEQGLGAYILFIIQMKGISLMRPNDITHAEFGAALREAKRRGVRILAYECAVTCNSLTADSPVRVEL